MTTLQLEQKEVIETEITPMLDRARRLSVRTKDDRNFAAGTISFFKEMRERIEETFHPTRNKQTAYKAYSDALETEKAFYGPIEEAEKLTKAAIKTFDTQEAIKAQQEAERLEAERRDKEEKERAKLEARAEKELEKGNEAKAATLLEQAEYVQVAPSFSPPPAATKKLVTKARVLNTFQLCKLIADGVIPFNVVEVKQSALNDWAKTQDVKQKFAGIELYQESAGRV